jgi:hypothetical protein
MKGTKYFMMVPLIEVCHFEVVVKADLGFGYKNPGILRGVELENKHDLTPFWLLQTVTKVFDARRIFFAYFLGNVNEHKILPSRV